MKAFNTLKEIVQQFPEHGVRDAIRYFNGFRIFHYSYAQVYDTALRCISFLETKDITKGDRVMIWAPNSPEWAIVYLACALRGIVLIPIDARLSPEFIEKVAQETEAKLLFRGLLNKDPGFSLPSFLLDSLFDTLESFPHWQNEEEIHPNDLMEIVYTSGTTSEPKGVQLTHHNIASNVTDVLKIIPVEPTYHLLSVLPLSHALEQTGGFWVPLAGGVSITYLRVLKPTAIFDVFHRKNMTAMVLVPRLLTILKNRIEEQLRDKHLTGYLRFGQKLSSFLPRSWMKWYFYPIHRRFSLQFHLFVSGGAALDPEVEYFWRSLGFFLLQGYGLTETGPVLTVTHPDTQALGSVGKPLEQVDIRLDKDNEVLVRGPNIFSGYYKREDLNQTVFDQEWFRTGDIGEFDDVGNLYIRSRKKDVIVTSDGINVYPEDIERVLDKQEAIKESCVLGMGEEGGEIYAILLMNDSQSDPQKAVQKANQKLLPEQQIASFHLWPLEEFPKTTTLKIKKNEVKKTIEEQSKSKKTVSTQTTNPLYKIICEMSHLQPDELKPEMELAKDIGLSSIERVELLSHLEEQFHLDVDESMIRADSTLADLEDYITQRKSSTASLPIRRWTRWSFFQFIRLLFKTLIAKPFIKIFCDLHIHGLKNLQDLQGPILFVMNHTSHLDTLLMQNVTPKPIRHRICPAAWKEYFEAHGRPFYIKIGKWLAWQFATIMINIFPFPQTTAYRQSMIYAGELVDDGWNILIFPEGQRSLTGQLLPFREGIGMLSQNLKIPIIPVAIDGGENVLLRGSPIPRRGTVHLSFGKPLLPQKQSYRELADQLKEEIERLRSQAKQNKVS